MKWWELLICTFLVWFLGLIILKLGLNIQPKKSHKKKFGDPESTPIVPSGDLIDIILGFIFLFFRKVSPWWLKKAFLILAALGLFYLGVLDTYMDIKSLKTTLG